MAKQKIEVFFAEVVLKTGKSLEVIIGPQANFDLNTFTDRSINTFRAKSADHMYCVPGHAIDYLKFWRGETEVDLPEPPKQPE
jgi:hypothetical protein